MKIAVLGGGMIGSVIAEMLMKDHDVMIVSKCTYMHVRESVNKKCYIEEFGFPGYERFLRTNTIWDSDYSVDEMDLIVNALPGKVGFDALTMAVEAGKNVVDVSFWDYDPERVESLNKLAKERGVTVLYDLGWSPGMTNILIGQAMAELGEVESVDYYVGGLPQSGPYKSPYCVEDSMKFALHATSIIATHSVERPFDILGCSFERRSLPSTCNPFTYRPTGFNDYIDTMHDYNMLSPENLPHTTEILRNEWAIDENYRDISYMDIYVRGKDKTIEYHMVDRYDEKLKMTSMAKLTATTAVLGVNLLLGPKTIGPHILNNHGIVSPEKLVEERLFFNHFWKGWKDAGIIIEKSCTFDGIPVKSALP